MNDQRRSGVLLHPTSLPEGHLGAPARRFIDFLAAAGFNLWQLLPTTPVDAFGSPYQSTSSFAGNPKMIALSRKQYDFGFTFDHESAADDIAAFDAFKRAYESHAKPDLRERFARFKHENHYWLREYARFSALKSAHAGAPWWRWPPPLRDREGPALAQIDTDHRDLIDAAELQQFMFNEQWADLCGYAHDKGVHLIGDLPMFVAHDSADVWAHRHLFKLDDSGQPCAVAGVPPDFFSPTGQRWGNPLHDWEAHVKQTFLWWRERINHQLQRVDLLRLDHFRGFTGAWEIPADHDTAELGNWAHVPGERLFEVMSDHSRASPFIAEDLGTITPDVFELRKHYAIPGMAVLQFAFDGNAANPYLPHNLEPDCLVCTGTHDNDTTAGWYESLGDEQRQRVMSYFGNPGEPMPWPMIRAAMASVCRYCVVPMQDLLGLGSEHRLNTPGTVDNNWSWRFEWDWIEQALIDRMRVMNGIYGRSGVDENHG